jgi:hypothetical protein
MRHREPAIEPSFNRKPEAHASEAELPRFPGNAGASGFGLNDRMAAADAGLILTLLVKLLI